MITTTEYARLKKAAKSAAIESVLMAANEKRYRKALESLEDSLLRKYESEAKETFGPSNILTIATQLFDYFRRFYDKDAKSTLKVKFIVNDIVAFEAHLRKSGFLREE